jgi:hypothetical protein
MTASLAQQARAYLADEMFTDTLAFQDVAIDPASAMLSEHAVILRVGGRCALLTVFSFSQELGDHLLYQATCHMAFSPERRMLYRRSVLAQAASVIAGRWLADIGDPAATIFVASPMGDAQNSHFPGAAVFANRSLMTEAGIVDILVAQAAPAADDHRSKRMPARYVSNAHTVAGR